MVVRTRPSVTFYVYCHSCFIGAALIRKFSIWVSVRSLHCCSAVVWTTGGESMTHGPTGRCQEQVKSVPWPRGARGVAVGWGTALQADSIPESVTGIFHWPNPSSRPVVDSASDRNEYQEYVLGVKAAYHLHVPIVWKAGSLNLLEPYGPATSLCRDCITFTVAVNRYYQRHDG
jgi:hypothetical protein